MAPESSPDPPSDGPTVGVVYHPDYLEHRTGRGHPERPERLTAIVEHLQQTGLWDAVTHIEPRLATVEEVAAVHGTDYIAFVDERCAGGGGLLDLGDTPVCPASYEAALLAAGGLLAGADAVVAGDVRNAFALVRPPGHHARRANGMGFCIFNNIAIAARYLQRRHGVGRVLIADWDVHHGNGTQEAFYDDPSVAFLSLHRYPFYPGTGAAAERGTGDAAGSMVNVPLLAGTGGGDFVATFGDRLGELAGEFPPDFVLVSAGFDGHRDDPLGGMALGDDDYAELARRVRAVADEYCGGRLLLTLEGGYDLGALGRSVAAVLRVLLA
ncbi:MAG: histone deacetylase [Planctomycetota bacterium]